MLVGLIIIMILFILATPLYSKIGKKVEKFENKIKEEIEENEKL